MEPSLDQFPAWIQTALYVGTGAVGLAVASHGYFKAWIKKIVPSVPAEPAKAAEGQAVASIMVMDRTALNTFSDALNRMDSTVRSVQDDLGRGHDRTDRLVDRLDKIIDLMEDAKGRTIIRDRR